MFTSDTNAETTTAKALNRHERLADGHTPAPAAWRVNDWRREVPMSRSKFYEERAAGRIETVKCGSSTLVVTPPQAYLATLRNMAA